MIRVKTHKGESGKWYVEVVESDGPYVTVGYRLDAEQTINCATFTRPTGGNDCGFESRRLAREYLKAYVEDTGEAIKGGLH